MSYISREKLMAFPIRRDHCDKEHANPHFINGIETVLEFTETLPTENVAPVIQAHWIPTSSENLATCSACGVTDFHNNWLYNGRGEYKYCPNCGARMGSETSTAVADEAS